MNAENNFKEKLLVFHRENQWRKILELNENSDDISAGKVLWVWPSEKNLKFLKSVFEKYGVQGVYSLGCGCGLLEWILEQFTGLPVTGYEINREWWDSKYSNPQFIDLKYVDNEHTLDFNPNYALLFCYFNNGPAFREYVKTYKGQVVIIIGPSEGSGRHTDPQPFCPDFEPENHTKWHLSEHQEVKNSKDFIAVYIRKTIDIIN